MIFLANGWNKLILYTLKVVYWILTFYALLCWNLKLYSIWPSLKADHLSIGSHTCALFFLLYKMSRYTIHYGNLFVCENIYTLWNLPKILTLFVIHLWRHKYLEGNLFVLYKRCRPKTKFNFLFKNKSGRLKYLIDSRMSSHN